MVLRRNKPIIMVMDMDMDRVPATVMGIVMVMDEGTCRITRMCRL